MGEIGQWVEATVWNERMLAALGNGVRGGKWFSLIDKVYRPADAQSGVAQSQGRTPERPESMGKVSSSLGFGQKSIWQNLSKRSRAESTGQSRSGA